MFWSRQRSERLCNWNGRKRSSRGGVPTLPRAWSRPLAARLTIVMLSAALIAGMLHVNDPPFPHRLNSILPHHFRARVSFEVPNQAYAAQQVEAMDAVSMQEGGSPRVDQYAVGALLVPRDQRIDPPRFVLLLAEHRAYAASLSLADRLTRLTSVVVICFALAIILCVYTSRFQPMLAASTRRVAGVCLLVIVCVGTSLLLSRPLWDAAIIPLTLTAMIMAIVYNPPFALLLSFSISSLLAIGHGSGLGGMLILSGGSATAILFIREIRSRSRPVEVSIAAGVAYFMLALAMGMLHDQPARLYLVDGLRYCLWSLLAGFILCGCLPVVERLFGVMTDATLLELADGSHPLMQEMVKRAPGSYTHSMTVATLAETAAEAIGANPLLTRVGSYFHDIGKMLKPHYFIENQTGENRHDQLEPALSTLVIMGHVKDGMALATEYRLPRPIIDMIQQHHGTTLVEYFYREAKRIQGEAGNAGDLEHAFRYPGPKPRSREAGILMLADASESASRALPVPTANALRKLVHELMMKRLLDGQFDECDLSMVELKRLEDSISRSLIAVFHARIRYKDAS